MKEKERSETKGFRGGHSPKGASPAQRKLSRAASVKQDWQRMKLWSGDDLCKLDWVVACLVLAFLFVSCAQGDIRLTGNRSFLMYEHFTDFYKASYEQSGGYYANYLPSTFIAYAIWNLPLYLIGHLPEEILTISFINIMWYKLLPVLLYIATAHLLYRIGLEAGFGEKKARLCRFAFLIFPIGVFSQFIFSQYDIFTVFFIVLGLYFYLKGGMWRFAFFMGVGVTFKYQALLYYLILLVLKEKKIRNLLKYTAAAAVPLLAEVLPNIRSEYFRKCVFGFGALDFVQKSFNIGFIGGINLTAAAVAFLLVWAYQRRPRDLEELFSWGMFFCVAVSFAVFGFSSWNPQWLLLFVPFLVLNILINENGNLLVMVTNIFMLALYIFCSQGIVTENVLYCGIFKYILPYNQFSVRLRDIYLYNDQQMLCAAMWVVLLVYAVFGHPKYHNRKGSQISSGLLWQFRSAFLFGTGAFLIPLGICVAFMFRGYVVFEDTTPWNLEGENIILVDEQSSVSQEFVADGATLSDVQIRVWNGERDISETVDVTIREKDSGTVIYKGERKTDDFQYNSAPYSFLEGPAAVEPGKSYLLELTCSAPAGEGIGLYCVSVYDGRELLAETEARKEWGDCRLQMRITGIAQ